MPNTTPTPVPPAAMDIPGAIWRRRWLILAITLIATAAAVGASLMQAPAYTATTKLWIKPTLINPPGSVPLPQTIILPTEAELVTSMPVAELAAGTLGVGDASTVLGHVSVSFPLDSQILLVSYSAASPTDARDGSQAFADAYLTYRGEEAHAQIDAAVAKAEEQLAGLRSKLEEATMEVADAKQESLEALSASNEVAQLNGQIATWENAVSLLSITTIDTGSVLTPAVAPSQPSTSAPVEDAIRGALFGLALGILAALTAEAIRRRRMLDAASAPS